MEKLCKKFLEIKIISLSSFELIECVNITELRRFLNAVKEAHGAVVYLCLMNSSGKIKVSLLCSKSRIPHMKEVSIPHLEMCDTIFLANLIKNI